MTGHLRVNPAVVAQVGNGLSNAAASVPSPPAGLSAVPAGDPLSAVAWAHQQAAEMPVLESLPHVRQRSAATAGKTTQAAQMYEATDTALGSRLNSAQFAEAGAAMKGGGATASGESESQLDASVRG